MRPPSASPGPVTVRSALEPTDPAVADLAALLKTTFADPNTVLELPRLQAFLAEPTLGRRRFHILVAEDSGGQVVGGTVFSYVVKSQCGFSEYLVARRDHRGQGLGRLLFDARRAVLDADARALGAPGARGLFIEADNPGRVPHDLREREAVTAMDPQARRRLFAHLGFFQVDMPYAQPPLGPGKQPVTYLDLLLAPWDPALHTAREIPASLVRQTVGAIHQRWAGTPRVAAREDSAPRQSSAARLRLMPL